MIYRLMYLFRVTGKALREGGLKLFYIRTRRFVAQIRINRFGNMAASNDISALRDVLFISGCSISAPFRYRVSHKKEQLECFGLTVKVVDWGDLALDELDFHQVFIFYRCEITPIIKEFVSMAKTQKKATIFDIDDLMFDKEYARNIDYLQTLSSSSYNAYMSHVGKLSEMMRLCDAVVVSSNVLFEEAKKKKADVFLNRNVASMELLYLSRKAESLSKNRDGKVRVGYLSGSISHNPDLELIEDALLSVALRYKNVEIVLVGLIEPSAKFDQVSDQVVKVPPVSWRDLPELISGLDINLAPLENTLFNSAKSEIKWSEAALVKVPTIASDVGSFSDVIVSGVTGVLCSDSGWEEAISNLVENELYRHELAVNAHKLVTEELTTVKTGRGIKEFLLSKMHKNFVFVIPRLEMSGGVRVVLNHASILQRHGCSVVIYVDDDIPTQKIKFDAEELFCVGTSVVIDAHIDTMVATLWTTVSRVLSQQNVTRKVYLVQGYEPGFYDYEQNLMKQLSSRTYLKSEDRLEYLSISKWCVRWLSDLYGTSCEYVPNGIDFKRFEFSQRKFKINGGRLKVLVEGNTDDAYKNVHESLSIVRELKKRYEGEIECHLLSYRSNYLEMSDSVVDQFHLRVDYDRVPDIYKSCDILIKSSRLESFSYPPLEMMASGGIVLVGKNDGNMEYAIHDENCLLYEIGDVQQAVDLLSALIGDLDRVNHLSRCGVSAAKERDWSKLNDRILDFWVR